MATNIDTKPRDANPGLTTVVNLKTDAYDVLIDRRTKWGNPFPLPRGASVAERAAVLERYRQWLMNQPRLVAAARRELRGKVLGCWCKPQACHGDVLAAVADAES